MTDHPRYPYDRPDHYDDIDPVFDADGPNWWAICTIAAFLGGGIGYIALWIGGFVG